MYLGHSWTTVDGVVLWEYIQAPTKILNSLEPMYFSIRKKYKMWAIAQEKKYNFGGYCSKNRIVMRNTDRTLKRFREGVPKNLCSDCRGKGHSWKCEIWNGRPYLGKPKGDHWKNPDWCEVCGG